MKVCTQNVNKVLTAAGFAKHTYGSGPGFTVSTSNIGWEGDQNTMVATRGMLPNKEMAAEALTAWAAALEAVGFTVRMQGWAFSVFA